MADIRIANVTKHFGAFHALKGIDLHVKDQEFMVLLGASGCGKSTLLRIIAGLESADTGAVHVGDERIDHLQAKDRRLSMVFQNYAVFPHLTVFENIAFGLRMQKATQQLNNTASLRVTRRDIARAKTILAQKRAATAGGSHSAANKE